MKPGKARACILVTVSETKCYCNSAALLKFARRLEQIAEAQPSEFHEVHLTMHLADDATRLHQSSTPNVWVVRSNEQLCEQNNAQDEIPHDAELCEFEVTFMHVSDEVLDQMQSEPNSRSG